jgi:protein-disulfide isomerase
VTDLRSAALPPLCGQDHLRGDPQAPLVIMYADFTCPYCALANERLRAVRIRLAFRHFALASRHPRAVPLACAAEAAALQGRFWEMHDALFADPGHVDDPHLWQRARRIGLDVDRFETDRRDQATAARVKHDLHGGLRVGVSATPTLFVDGHAHPGPPDATWLAALSQTAQRAGFPAEAGPGIV